MAKLTLTKEAQQVMDWVNEGNEINDLEEDNEMYNFVASISKGDGFWYCLKEGGYLDPKKIVVEASERELTMSELFELDDMWTRISFEF